MIIKKVEPFKIASIREIIPSYDKQGPLWEELIAYLSENNIKTLHPCVVNYHDSGYKESDVDVEVAIHVASNVPNNERIIFRDLEGYNEMACVIHKGSYERIAPTYNIMLKWIEENGYKIIGKNRALLLDGGWSVKNPEEYITEIQIPVAKE
ncbi:MAG: GyrI-like domain-containing protein [Clostridiaceae bacterium]